MAQKQRFGSEGYPGRYIINYLDPDVIQTLEGGTIMFEH
jgi:hypothetical protein